MGSGSSKISGGGGGSDNSQDATNKAITSFLTDYGRQPLQTVTSLRGVSGRIPSRRGGVVTFNLSQSRNMDSLGQRQYILSSNGIIYTMTSLSDVRRRLTELAGF